MIKKFAFYDISTGAIHGNHILIDGDNADAIAAKNIPDAGHAVFACSVGDGPDAATQMIDVASGAVIARGPCPITPSVAARVVTLSGVPSGAAYNVSGDYGLSFSGTVDDSGELAITFGAPGTYSVAVPCFPMVDYAGSFTLA